MAADTILSIDSSGRWTSLGVWHDGPAGHMGLNLGRRQAACLPGAAQHLLSTLGLKWDDLTALALVVGPGYFTALRIGLAYGCGLAMALGIPVIGLSSLEVLARSARRDGLVVPLIAASRKLAFCGAWDGETCVLEEAERSRDQLNEALEKIKGSKFLIAADDERLFSADRRDGISFIPCSEGLAAAELGYARRGEARPPEGIRAQYLREPGLGKSE